MNASRVLSNKKLHVPPVDGMTGYVDGIPCEITWVSRYRDKVRVRFLEGLKAPRTKVEDAWVESRQGVENASPKHKKKSSNPFQTMDMQSSDSEEEKEDEEAGRLKKEEEHAAALKIQATWRRKSGRQAILDNKAKEARKKTLAENLKRQVFDGREAVMKIRWVTPSSRELFGCRGPTLRFRDAL